MARLVTVYTPEKLEEIEKQFLTYIEVTEIPIVSEFCYSIGMIREEIYKHPELSYALKLCITKKENVLESGTLRGKWNPAMAIFSLKQIGWKDKSDEVAEQKDPINLTINIKNDLDPNKQDNLEIHEGT